jgi:hypothetical protein
MLLDSDLPSIVLVQIPDNVSMGVEECRKRCGIKPRQDNILQQPQCCSQRFCSVICHSIILLNLNLVVTLVNFDSNSLGIGKGAIVDANSNLKDASNNAGPFNSENYK